MYIKLSFLGLAILFSSQLAFAQGCYCNDGEMPLRFMITAPSGLILRTEPNTDSYKLDILHEGTEVWTCIEDIYKPIEEMIEGEKGYWRKVQHGKWTGYLFDGFMEQIQEPEIMYSSVPYSNSTKDIKAKPDFDLF